jgi:hypothetical protein
MLPDQLESPATGGVFAYICSSRVLVRFLDSTQAATSSGA